MCIYILVATNSHPIRNGSEMLFVISFATMAPYENILFDVGPRLVASAFSINAKRSVLGRHPMEHFTSLSKMACVCKKRHVSYSNRASLSSCDRGQDEGNTKITHFFGQLMFHGLPTPMLLFVWIQETWQRLIIIIIIIPLSFCNFSQEYIDFNPI